jgi:hypothetical protein
LIFIVKGWESLDNGLFYNFDNEFLNKYEFFLLICSSIYKLIRDINGSGLDYVILFYYYFLSDLNPIRLNSDQKILIHI